MDIVHLRKEGHDVPGRPLDRHRGYGKYFKSIGLDAVVGSVGSGVTLRMISDIEGVKYTEGRLLPYFFPMCSARAAIPSARPAPTG